MSQQIITLKRTDSHFAGLSDKYDELEHSIHLIEAGTASFGDEHLEELKKIRLKLKDEISAMLQRAA